MIFSYGFLYFSVDVTPFKNVSQMQLFKGQDLVSYVSFGEPGFLVFFPRVSYVVII